ncbi:MAG: diguanylate cyclase [Desulfobacterales bacterium]|nr:diguanylate cyclase [Desulfobacterales bacterium]
MHGNEVQADSERHFTLKSKVLLILVVIFALYGAVDYAIQRLIIFPSFLRLEQYEAEQNLERSVSAIKREIHHLDSLCHDWSAWDDTYDFAVSLSHEYIKSALVLSTFTNNRLSLIYICDTKGKVLWGEIRDLKTGKKMHLPDFPEHAFPKNHPLFTYASVKKPPEEMSAAGILVAGQVPILISSRPILTSDNKGPIRGYIIMGRFLNDDIVKTLASQIRVDFGILPGKNGLLPDGIKKTDPQIGEYKYLFKKADKNYLLIYAPFPDINGGTAFWIKTKIPRKIIKKGVIAIQYALMSNLAAGLIVLTVMLLLFQKTIIGPVTRLTNHILLIKKNRDFSIRFSMNRKDEIGALAGEFDRMLEQIDMQTRELAKLNENLKSDIAKRMEVEEALQKANQELKTIANVDGLTQIANRRRFDEFLDMQWKQMRRDKKILSLILCDIDFFKLYNDTYGHQPGDDCLRSVAQVIYRNLKRPSDLAARYGGEEFAMILPDTNPVGAFYVAEKIRKEVQELRISHARSPIYQYVTLSLGIYSVVPNQRSSQELLIETADMALYEAKKQGRNRSILKTGLWPH